MNAFIPLSTTAAPLTIYQQLSAPTNYASCVEAKEAGQGSGYTLLQPAGQTTVYELWCDQDSYGGGR